MSRLLYSISSLATVLVACAPSAAVEPIASTHADPKFDNEQCTDADTLVAILKKDEGARAVAAWRRLLELTSNTRTLSTDTVTDIALHAPSTLVRRDAIMQDRLSDDVLQSILLHDPRSDVVYAAIHTIKSPERVRAMLVSPETSEQAKVWLMDRPEAEPLRRSLVLEAASAKVRNAALHKFPEDDLLLVEVAAQDADAHVRDSAETLLLHLRTEQRRRSLETSAKPEDIAISPAEDCYPPKLDRSGSSVHGRAYICKVAALHQGARLSYDLRVRMTKDSPCEGGATERLDPGERVVLEVYVTCLGVTETRGIPDSLGVVTRKITTLGTFEAKSAVVMTFDERKQVREQVLAEIRSARGSRSPDVSDR